MSDIWRELEIARTADRDAIRRAYARKLKRTNPEDDAAGFKRLREAYELALRHAQWQAWDATDDDDAAPVATEAPADTVPADAVHGDGADRPFWSAPNPAPATPRIDPAEAELRDTLARDRADLEARFAALAEVVRGPWGGHEQELSARFRHLMAAPALMELGAREQIEQRVAALATAELPRGDGLIDLAARSFGWFRLDPRVWHGPALSAALNRIEEWRIIERLSKGNHPLHNGWHALTTAPGAYWAWRLDTLIPGTARQVRTLLGLDDTEVADGLKYSFNKDAVARWRGFFTKPRLTLGMLALAPLLFALTAVLATAIAPARSPVAPALWIGGSVIALASPVFPLFILSRWRERWRAAGGARSDIWRYGWLALFLLIAGLTAPAAESAPGIAALAAAMGVAAIWLAIVRGDPAAMTGREWGNVAYIAFLSGLFGLAALAPIDARHGLAIALLAALTLCLRVYGANDIAVLAQRLFRAHASLALSLIAAAGAAALLVVAVNAAGSARAFAITAYVAFELAALLLLAGAARTPEPQTVARFRVMVGIAMIAGLIIAGPDQQRGGADPDSQTLIAPSVEPASKPEQVRLRLDAMAAGDPGLAQVQRDNPDLWRAVTRIVTNDIGNDEPQAVGADVFAMLNQEYQRRLPLAPDALIARLMRHQLAALIDRRDRFGGDCAGSQAATTTSSDPEGRELFFDVLAAQPRTASKAAKVPADAALIAEGSKITNLSVAWIKSGLSPSASDVKQCDARIAYLTALTRRPDAQIGAWYRAVEATPKRR